MEISRRTFTLTAAPAGLLALLPGCRTSSRVREDEPAARRDETSSRPSGGAGGSSGGDSGGERRDRAQDTLDEALTLLAGTGPEFSGGLANHGPMAAEALCALGRPEAVIPWLEGYRSRLGPAPGEERPLPAQAIVASLGDFDRFAGFRALVARSLEERPWGEVVEEWTARLCPGVAAAALHGIIRTAHAARALAGRDTSLRRGELASGIAYWAARYQPLPSPRGAARPGIAIADAIGKLPALWPERTPPGLIADSLRALDRLPAFPDAIGAVTPAEDHRGFLSQLTEAFASTYLANRGRSTFAFLHAITGPAAVGLLLPYLTRKTAERALAFSWHAAAGIYSVFARPGSEVPRDLPAIDPHELVDRALSAEDEHAFKLVEACLREHAVNPSPLYLAAARDAAERL
jgi:hypothetical protein